TQVYPESFLRLSYSQREKLQKTLQQLGGQVREQLQERWQQAQKASHQSFQDDGLALIKQLFLQAEAVQSDSKADSASGKGAAPTIDSSAPDQAASAKEDDTKIDGAKADDVNGQPFEDDLADWLSATDKGSAKDTEGAEQRDLAQPPNEKEEADSPRYRLLKVEETEAGTNISFVDGEDPARASLRDRILARLSAYKASASPTDQDKEGARDQTAPPTDGEEPTPSNDIAADNADNIAADNTAADKADAAILRSADGATGDNTSGDNTSNESASNDSNAPHPSDTPSKPTLSEPTQLLRLQLFTEKSIRDVLKTISETANYLLQQESIIPEMPKALLAAAAESDGLSQTPMKTPNLLRISVRVLHDGDENDLEDEEENDNSTEADEDNDFDDSLGRRLEQMLRARAMGERASTDDDDDDEGDSAPPKGRMPRILQIESLPEFIVIHLRLSEVEFADPRTAAQRRLIRAKMNDLKKLGRVYKRAQRQLAIAQAEDAWRASWIE
ncbi:MAG: hypothetical protein AAFU71_15885, partial [Cyanobacteria bacterium J06632_22]